MTKTAAEDPFDENTFHMWIDETYKEVAADLDYNSVEFSIKIENYFIDPITIELTYALEENEGLGSLPDNWDYMMFDGETEVPSGSMISLPGMGVGPGIQILNLIVTANPYYWPGENDMGIVNIGGRFEDPLFDIERGLWAVGLMNSYEVDVYCEKPFDYVIAGSYIEYSIKATNKGSTFDKIDITYSCDKSWTVTFSGISDTNGNQIPDTNWLNPKTSKTFKVKISVPAGAAQYTIGKTTITGTSAGDTSETDSLTTKSRVVSNTLYCISDKNNNDGTVHKHNVQRGYLTTFVIDVFNVVGASQGTVKNFRMDSNFPSGWSSKFEYYDANNNGGTWEVDSGIEIENNDFPNQGDYVEVKVSVWTSSSEAEGTLYNVKMQADDHTSSPATTKSLTTEVRIISERKIYLVGLNGVNYASFELNNQGNTYTGGASEVRLWQNTYDNFISKKVSRWQNPIDIFPAAADMNYVGMLTSTRVDGHGLSFVAYHYTGQDTSNNPTFKAYEYKDVQAEFVFSQLKNDDSNLKIAVVSAKNWLNDIICENDVDISVCGVDYPNYIDPPDSYVLTEKDGYQGDKYNSPGELFKGFKDNEHDIPFVIPKELAKLTPDDEWVFEAAERVILHEDPDFLVVINVEPDTAGHIWGSETDNNQGGSKKASNVNSFANQNRMLKTMEKCDYYLNEFIKFLQNRKSLYGNTWHDAIYRNRLIITADHGMRTAPIPDVDVKKILEDANPSIKEGTDYDYVEGIGVGAFIFGIKDAQTETTIKNVLNNYKTNNPGEIWQIMDQNAMTNGKSDKAPTKDQPFAYKFDETYSVGNYNCPYKNPDITVILEPYHQNKWYGNEMGVIIKTFGKGSIFSTMDETLYPSRLNVGMIGHHTPYSDAKIPLYFSYSKSTNRYGRAEIIDIIPTICSGNGWNTPDDAEGKVLKLGPTTIYSVGDYMQELNLDDLPWAGFGNPQFPDTELEYVIYDVDGDIITEDDMPLVPHSSGDVEDPGEDSTTTGTSENDITGVTLRETDYYSSGERNNMDSDVSSVQYTVVDSNTKVFVKYPIDEDGDPADLVGSFTFYNQDGSFAFSEGFTMTPESTKEIDCNYYAPYWSGQYANLEIFVTNDVNGIVGTASRVYPEGSMAMSEPLQSAVKSELYGTYLREDTNWDTIIILQNPTVEIGMANIDFYNLDGTWAYSYEEQVNPHGSVSINCDPYKLYWNSDYSTVKISMIQGTGLLGIVQRINNIEHKAMSEPLISDCEQGLSTPFLTEKDAWNTKVLLHNPHSTGTNTVINFYNYDDGSPAGEEGFYIEAYATKVIECEIYRQGWVSDRANIEVKSDNGLIGIVIAEDVANCRGYSLAMSPQNIPPEACFVYDNIEGYTYTFDGSDSSDFEGVVIEYYWDFGDDSAIVTGEIVGYTYAQSGQYQVTLTVCDDKGALASTTQTIDVQ